MSNGRGYYYPRSLFGPLLIAALGVVFLLRNLGVLSWQAVGWWFSQYWPVLIIIWGVVKFIEYLWARHHERPAPGLGAGGVVLLIFLIITGLIASKASGVNWSALGDEFDIPAGNDWGIFGNQYEFTQDFSQPVTAATQVKVLGAHGNITLSASPDDQAHVFVHKYIRSHSQDEANKLNGNTHSKFEQQGGVLVLDMVSGSFGDARIDLDLQLPRRMPATISTRHGDIRVSERDGNVDLDSSHGDIDAEDIRGDVSLRLRRGDASVKNITGNVVVDGTVGDSRVSDVTGTLTFTGSYTGDVQLSHVSKQVHFSSIRTDLQLAKLDGDLSMDRGDFKANAIAGPFRLNTQVKDVHVEDITGDVHIEDTRGDIEVHTKTPVGSVEISNSAGEINISLPEQAGFQVDAQSTGGEIQSDFQLSINNGAGIATASGVVGKGGPQVRLKTNRGTIQIKKG